MYAPAHARESNTRLFSDIGHDTIYIQRLRASISQGMYPSIARSGTVMLYWPGPGASRFAASTMSSLRAAAAAKLVARGSSVEGSVYCAGPGVA